MLGKRKKVPPVCVLFPFFHCHDRPLTSPVSPHPCVVTFRLGPTYVQVGGSLKPWQRWVLVHCAPPRARLVAGDARLPIAHAKTLAAQWAPRGHTPVVPSQSVTIPQGCAKSPCLHPLRPSCLVPSQSLLPGHRGESTAAKSQSQAPTPTTKDAL